MTDVATLIADMIRQGIDPDMIGRVAAALAERETIDMSTPPLTPRQKANARYYQARKERLNASETILNSLNSDVSDEIKTPEAVPSSEQKTPTPPKTQPSPSQEKTPKGVQKKGSELPESWQLTDEDRQEAERIGLHGIEVGREAEKFRDYWRSKPGAGRLKTDWKATWRNWCRSAVERRWSRAPPRPAEPRPGQTGNRWIDAVNEIAGHDEQANHNPTDSGPARSHDTGTRNPDRPDGEPAAGASRLAAPLLDFERGCPDDGAAWGFGGAQGGTDGGVHPRR